MGCREAMIVAGIGCRRGCPAEAIVALVREAGAVDVLAAPAWKREEAGLLEAARVLGLPLVFVGDEAMAAAQARCVTRSAAVARAVGVASVAEAAALADGGALVRPRFGGAWATCAVAEAASPPPLEGGGRGEGCHTHDPGCDTRQLPRQSCNGHPSLKGRGEVFPSGEAPLP